MKEKLQAPSGNEGKAVNTFHNAENQRPHQYSLKAPSNIKHQTSNKKQTTRSMQQ